MTRSRTGDSEEGRKPFEGGGLSWVLTQHEPLRSAIDAYQAFDERQPGWLKVKLEPAR